MVSAPRVLRAADERGEDLVIVLAAAQIAGDPVRQFGSSRTGIGLQEPDRRHDETRHAEGTLESLFVDDTLLYWMQRSVVILQALGGQYSFAAHRVREYR